MKTKVQFALIALTLIVTLVFSAGLANANQSVDAPQALENVVIRIDGMTCSACANGVAASLRRVEGVVEAEVSIEPPEAYIKFDPSVTSADVLVEAIEDLGYKAELVQS